MVEDAMDTRVVKVTLERADGEIDTRVIGNNDGVVCLVFSKEQNFQLSAGYCEDLETQAAILAELIKIANDFARDIEKQVWVDKHKN